MSIRAVSIPIVFTNPGTYDVGGGKQKTAFGRGTVYFRHGAKSDPGTTKDLRDAVERQLENIRRGWLGGIRKVVTAPAGHAVHVLPEGVRLDGSPTATAVRLVDDKSAPPFKAVRTDALYPHREKEVVAQFNRRVPGKRISGYDVQCVRKAHGVDANPNYFYRPQFSSPQYSEAFVDWLVLQIGQNGRFFDEARRGVGKR
jgi:hypothetical protein